MQTHYAVLGVSDDADEAEIRRAFRRLAWAAHPDRNANLDAEARFQRLNEAYVALSRPETRTAYDRKLRADAPAMRAPDPIRCSECGRTTAQPRILKFRSVRSMVVWSWQRTTEGLFCVRCARRTAMRSSVISGVCGWWAVPFGPLLTWRALAGNALSGARRSVADDVLLLQNARAFAARKETRLAHALARQVGRGGASALGEEAARLMAHLPSSDPEPVRLRDPWRPTPRHLLAHLGLATIAPTAVGAACWWFLASAG